MPCLSANQLSEYIEGVLPEDERQVVEAELASCADCSSLLCEWAQTTLHSVTPDADRELEGEADHDEVAHKLHRRGERIENFELLEFLGAGGMGMVFLGRDEELDRDVAIKIVHPRRVGRDQPDSLTAEARAMAAVRHPNVVSIYAAGRSDDVAFIAMERVDGATLRAWLEEPRSHEQRAALFAGLARGLAAIHEAGFVHRDVKPSNVLVDREGTAKLADFGLASRDATAGIVGTPAFMAPEVRAGGEASTASDQFSFCRTLSETWPDPARPIATAVARGLAADPDARFGSMNDLAVALERAARPSRRWPWALAIACAVGLTAAGIAALGAGGSSERIEACERASQQLDGLWVGDARDAVSRRFAASKRPWANASFERIDRALESSIRSWKTTRFESCAAPPPDTAAAVALCLDRAASSLARAVDALADASPAVVDAAGSITKALAQPSRCASVQLASASDSPLAIGVDRASFANAAGSYDQALVILAELEPLVATASEPALAARYHRAAATASRRKQRYREAESQLKQAEAAASLAASPALLADIHRDLALIVGYYLDRPDAAKAHLDSATVWANKSGVRVTHAEIADARGLIAAGRGDHAQAMEAFDRALAIYTELGDSLGRAESLYLRGLSARFLPADRRGIESLEEALKIRRRELGDGHPDVFRVFNAIGLYLASRGDIEGAFDWFKRAATGIEAALGPDDPELATALNALGSQELARGRYEDAQRSLERALAIRQRALGPNDVDTARTLTNLGSLHYYKGEPDRAKARYLEALQIASKALGANHPDVGEISNGVGLAALSLGDTEGARRHMRRAVTVARASDDAVTTANALGNLAMVEATFESWDEAHRIESEALALRESALGPKHPAIAFSHAMLAEIELGRGRLGDAENNAMRAIEIRREAGVAPQLIAETTFVLAMIRWKQRKRADARALARTALADLGKARPDLAAIIETWLERPH